MEFKDILNQYIATLNCAAKDLSKTTGLSYSVISRYRSGDRQPLIQSEQWKKLINGLYLLAKEKSLNLTKKSIESTFLASINNQIFDYQNFSSNFNELINTLKISVKELSRQITFDPSHISRIRNGERKPSNPNDFIQKICTYVVDKYNDENSFLIISQLLECEIDLLKNRDNYFNNLERWLISNTPSTKNSTIKFLNHLDSFNLSQYIKLTNFDKLKVINIPFYKINSRHYYGINGMKKGELDFFKATLLSKSKEPIFMCSDMPMEDMAQDVEFGKKWMFSIAMTLKKGLSLNIIHNLDRPYNEMMLGLESWIPIYMTGQVKPYYFSNYNDNIYHHLNYVSGVVSLTGECINNHHKQGKYYLSSNKKEVIYNKEKCSLLLKKAQSLMDIYLIHDQKEYTELLQQCCIINRPRYRILSSLPLFTIEEKLLISILKRNNVPISKQKKILNYRKKEIQMINTVIKKNTIIDTYYSLSEKDFTHEKVALSLENIFIDKSITYSYNEYMKHLNSTTVFANKNKNYQFIIKNDKIFNNIKVNMIQNNCVIISKSGNPIIHFVIKHPKLIKAIQNFSAPIH